MGEKIKPWAPAHIEDLKRDSQRTGKRAGSQAAGNIELAYLRGKHEMSDLKAENERLREDNKKLLYWLAQGKFDHMPVPVIEEMVKDKLRITKALEDRSDDIS